MGNARKECASHEPKENHAAGRCLHCPLRCLEALVNHWQSGRKLTSARHAPAVKSVRAFDRHAEPRSNAPTPLRRREQHGGTAMRRGRPALHGARGVERLPQPPSSSYPELAKTLPWLQRAVSGSNYSFRRSRSFWTVDPGARKREIARKIVPRPPRHKHMPQPT